MDNPEPFRRHGGRPHDPEDSGHSPSAWDDEIRHRLRMEEADAAHRRRKDQVVFWTVVGLVIVTAFTCVWVLAWWDNYGPEDRAWARMQLTTIVSAGVGFVAGRLTGRKKS
jgi:hypothetical protein